MIVLFALTKVDLISAPVVATQLSLLADAIKRYPTTPAKGQPGAERVFPGGIVMARPVSRSSTAQSATF